MKKMLGMIMIIILLGTNTANFVYAIEESKQIEEQQKQMPNLLKEQDNIIGEKKEEQDIEIQEEVKEETVVTVTYEYQEKTNTVIATMVSNKELQDTKVSWQLSEDKKQYTFEFNSNTTYTTTVTDIEGNVIEVLIEVTRN